MTKWKIILLCTVAACSFRVLAQETNTPHPVIAWGAQVSAPFAPYVTGLRGTCYASPAECIGRFKPTDRVSYLAISIADAAQPDLTLQHASEYADVARIHPRLKEIGIDDFWSFIRRVKVDNREKYLDQLIDNAKSNNSGLKFGVTIYEDQINDIDTAGKTWFTKDIRSKIDRVAFYLHHREGVKSYDRSLERLRALFPNAEIYGGVYHYDRIDYLDCQAGTRRKCSNTDELSLYRRTLEIQLNLLQNKKIAGLEFYPGFIGNEARWKPWQQKRICDENRKDQCIRNSEEMGRISLELLRMK